MSYYKKKELGYNFMNKNALCANVYNVFIPNLIRINIKRKNCLDNF